MKHIFVIILAFAFCLAVRAQNEISHKLPEGEPVDSYGKLNPHRCEARLSNFYMLLAQDKSAQGLIVLRFDKKDSQKSKLVYLKSLLKSMSLRNIKKTMISFAIYEGDAEETTLWIVPEGADLPENETTNYKLIKAKNFETEISKLFPTKIIQKTKKVKTKKL